MHASLPSPHRPANQAFIALLIEARASKRLVQTELAQRLNKPPSYVAKVELGERRSDVVEFVEYANALGVSPACLLKRLLLRMKSE